MNKVRIAQVHGDLCIITAIASGSKDVLRIQFWAWFNEEIEAIFKQDEVRELFTEGRNCGL